MEVFFIYVFFLFEIGGPYYIRPNQSVLYHKKKLQNQTKKELDSIINRIVSILNDYYQVPRKSFQIQQFTKQLEILFNERYFPSLSYLDIYRTRKEYQLVQSIKHKLYRTNTLIMVDQ